MVFTGRELIASRCAKFFEDGALVNLGIGIPLLCAKHVPAGVDIFLQAEIGTIGYRSAESPDEWDIDVADAGAKPAVILPGGCVVPHDKSFGLIRGGHIGCTVLGALQVDGEGNLANWIIPGKLAPGMGGAMDLCSGVKKIIVATEHCDKTGRSKILKRCTLPLTGAKCVTDIVTERCYFKVGAEGLILMELAPGYTVEDIRACTEADFTLAEHVGIME